MTDQNSVSSSPLLSGPLMTVADVSKFAGLGESTVWEMSRDGRLPKPIKLGARMTRWLPSDMEAWLQGLIAARA